MIIYRCNNCGNLVFALNDEKNLQCCGKSMLKLNPNITDAATEKHVPVVDISGKTINVKIGEIQHPMQNEHYINWVALETENGFYVKQLKPNEAPAATFKLEKEKPIAVYEFCNLHGLWKKDLS